MLQNRKMLLNQNLIEICFRNRYSLTENDERFLALDEIDMYKDVLLMERYEAIRIDPDFEKKEELKNQFGFDEFDELIAAKEGSFSVYAFSEEEIEEWWQDDSVFGKDKVDG